MGSFRYANPPLIHWGAGSVAQLPAELERLGIARPALVTTHSVAQAGARLVSTVATVTIRQHAPETDIETGVAAVREAGADGLVSVGGGSPIDAAKVISLRAGDARLPHVAVPTTLSVAELAAGAGYTDAAGNKAGLRDPRGLPDAVVYDAELTLATPLELWLATGMRAVDHAVEGYLSEGDHPLSDVLAVEGLRRLLASLPQAADRPRDVGVRTENQLGAWFGYTLPGPTAAGLGHMLGKQIGARHGIPHGVTSCLLLPHVVRHRARRQPDRVAALARAVGAGVDGEALATSLAELIQRLALPHRIRDFDLGEADLRTAAEALAPSVGEPAGELFEIYRAAV